jgi:hypothetical protein
MAICCMLIHLSSVLRMHVVVPSPDLKPYYSRPVTASESASFFSSFTVSPSRHTLTISYICIGLSPLSDGVCYGVLFSTTSLVQLRTSGKCPSLMIFVKISRMASKNSQSLQSTIALGTQDQPIALRVLMQLTISTTSCVVIVKLHALRLGSYSFRSAKLKCALKNRMIS